MQKRATVLAAVVVAAALSLAACSSSSSTGASTAKSQSAGTTSQSGPIKIFVYGQITGQAFAQPEIVTGAQAAINMVNAQGGVNGRKLQLISCTNDGNVNQDVACAREAVTDQVAAVVGTLTLTQQQSIPVVTAANIPVVAGTDTGPIYRQDPNSFPVLTGPPLYAGQAAALLAKRSCKHPAMLAITTSDATAASVSFGKYMQQHDPSASKVKIVTVPTGATDISAQVAEVLSGGTDCLGTALDPTTQLESITAVGKSGQNVLISANAPSLPASSLKTVGSVANDIVVSSPFYLNASDSPQTAQYIANMTKTNPKATIDTLAESSYDGVLIVALAAKGLSTVDGQTLIASLKKLTDVDTGLSPSINFTKPNPLSCMPRVFLTEEFAYHYANGEYALTSHTPYDVQSALSC